MIISLSALGRFAVAPIEMVRSLISVVEENHRSAQRLTRAIDSCVSIETVGRVTEVAQGVNRDAWDYRE